MGILNVNVGDKIKLTKPFSIFKKNYVGNVYEVIEVDDETDSISFNAKLPVFDGKNTICTCNITTSEFVKNFVVCERKEQNNDTFKTVSSHDRYKFMTSNENFNRVLLNSEIKYITLFGETTIVSVKFPNNYVITVSTPCKAPIDYDEQIAIEICMERIMEQYENYLAFAVFDSASDYDSVSEYGDDDDDDDNEWYHLNDDNDDDKDDDDNVLNDMLHKTKMNRKVIEHLNKQLKDITDCLNKNNISNYDEEDEEE